MLIVIIYKKELLKWHQIKKMHLGGFLASLILGAGVGGIVYTITKVFNLKSSIWFIPFIFLPPIIGAIIYKLSNGK